jgi:indole-3-acetate monooxygenase
MPVGNAEESNPTLEAARALLPQIRAASAELEEGRRLPMHIVQAMKDAGIFRMAMPRAWGGPELDPLAQLRVIEALAYADGSVGWCAMINIDGGYFGAFIDQDMAREMYRDLDAPTGASIVFSGRAVPAEGGYRVSGKWPFVSGCQHCKWIICTCTIYDGEAPRTRSSGAQERRLCFLPAAEGEVLDTWYTTGLRGSGSHDFTVKDVFVPEERTCPFPPEPRRAGALYAFPLLFGYKLPGVVLGIARNAVDTFADVARRKQVTMAMLAGRSRMLAEEGYAQSAIGRADAMVGSARSYVFERMEEIWKTLVAGHQPSLEQRARYRLAVIHAHATCLEAVELLYKVYGGSAVYASAPFDRCLRDILTINQHTMNSLKIYETAGRILLGFEPRAHDELL